EQGRDTANKCGKREPAAAGRGKRAEAEQERAERGREDARAGVLEADREDEAGSVDEEVAAGVAQDQIPQERRDQRRGRGRDEHARAPLTQSESHQDNREDGGGNDAPDDRDPARHQDGSRPRSRARFLNSYKPSKSGPVSSSIVSSSTVSDRPRRSTSSPVASGAS